MRKLLALFALCGGCAGSPTAPAPVTVPSTPPPAVTPDVSGTYGGIAKFVLGSYKPTCSALVTIKQEGSIVEMSNLTLMGGCGITIPGGKGTIRPDGEFRISEVGYNGSCGSYGIGITGKESGGKLALDVKYSYDFCAGFTVDADLIRVDYESNVSR